MKINALFLGVALVTLLFASCGEKEGIYNPERKIIKVETTTTSIREVRDNPTDEWEFYDSNSHVNSEVWTWNGDKLINIRYSTDALALSSEEVLEFEYDGNRIQRIVVLNREQRFEVGYDGRKVETIIMYNNDMEVAKAIFSHKRGKVSSIEEQTLDYLCAKDKELFNRITGVVMDSDPMSISVDNIERSPKNIQSDNFIWYSEWLDFEWDGDNIGTSIYYTESRDKKYATYEYAYDNASNPYAGMTYGGLVGDFGEQTFLLNANNVTRKKTTYTSGETGVQDFIYTYDNNWPISKTNVNVDSYYLPSINKYNQVTKTTVTRYTYQDND